MTPAILQVNGIGARAMKGYYGMPMGGAFANGNDAAAINFLQKQVFDANIIPQSVKFEFSSKVSDSDSKKVDITVKAIAADNIPEGVKLHILITEKRIRWIDFEDDWDGIQNGKVPNGQDMMYDVLWDMIGDTLGNDFPAISAGEDHSMTHEFVLYENYNQNKDSIEVTAILQVESTKQILAVARMAGSPYLTDSNPITFKGLKNKINSISLRSIGGTIEFNLPFKHSSLSLYNTAGRVLKSKKINGEKGQPVSINLPDAKGVVVLKLNSVNGDSYTESIIIK